MSIFERASLVVIAAASLWGCDDEPVDRRAEGEKLMQVSRAWSDVVATGNLEAVMAGWADDAIMMPPGLPAIEGKAAIRNYVEGATQAPGFTISWEPISAHVSDNGDMAYLIERNAISFNDETGNPVTTYGKVVTVWRKDPGGEWKNVVDMWNEAPSQ